MRMHLTDGYPNIAKYKKVPTEICKSFQNKLQQAKEDIIKKKARAEEEYCRATHQLVYDDYESRDNKINSELIASIRALLEHQYMYDE